MKKILVLAIVILITSASGSTQQLRNNNLQDFRIERGFKKGQLNRAERFRLRNDRFRYRLAQKRARRDGVITPGESRRLNMMRRKNNLQVFRLKHNRRHRII